MLAFCKAEPVVKMMDEFESGCKPAIYRNWEYQLTDEELSIVALYMVSKFPYDMNGRQTATFFSEVFHGQVPLSLPRWQWMKWKRSSRCFNPQAWLMVSFTRRLMGPGENWVWWQQEEESFLQTFLLSCLVSLSLSTVMQYLASLLLWPERPWWLPKTVSVTWRVLVTPCWEKSSLPLTRPSCRMQVQLTPELC